MDRRFEAAVVDWDGTAVADRSADASSVRRLIEELCAAGFEVAVVSGTNVDNVDGQLQARPQGPGRLHLLLNRGSEVFAVGADGPVLLERRSALTEENRGLSEAASLAVGALRARGLDAEIVSERLNRRKIDLIPEEAWRDPPKARIGELVDAVERRLRSAGVAGLLEAAAIAEACAREAGLADPRVTSDAKHVEIGLTDKSDSARWILAELWRRGVAPELVLVVGDELGPLGGLPGSDSLLLAGNGGLAAVSVGVEPGGVPAGVAHLGAGPATLLALLGDQLERRRARAVPRIAALDSWHVSVSGVDPELERVHEALLTLVDGRIGTSATPIAQSPEATPGVFAAGTYADEGIETGPLEASAWNLLGWEREPAMRLERVLDLRTGLLRQELETAEGPLEALLFSSLARPGTVALRVEGPCELVEAGDPFIAAAEPAAPEGGRVGEPIFARTTSNHAAVSAAAVEATVALPRGRCRLERLALYEAHEAATPVASSLVGSLRRAQSAGFERLLVEQRAAWSGRWEDADVVVEGDSELQLQIRFALYHLIGSVAADGEAPVGARGLTGSAYGGHVFWDADVFVLPFLAATHPPSARAMLEYRVNRLDAARSAAAAGGYRGARFPWESARTGSDVTPRMARTRAGETVEIKTGLEEEHITADVAWSAACYLDWTGDEAFAAGPGRDLLVETARYWASRLRVDAGGRGHVERVIGPDEYHEDVNDNAFTNVMARWNLRRGAHAALSHGGATGDEAAEWLRLADVLVDGYEAETGLYEQFAGFFDLEPLVAAESLRRPAAADLLLGRRRVQSAQILKQADVLMLHQLLPGEVAPGSLEPNLGYYEPRTAHGSSLSPGIHASLLARAGRLVEAIEWLRLAARLDLADLTQTTAGGVHLATMGSVWQALVWGFAGVRPADGALAVDPRLPDSWSALEVRLRYRGVRVRVRVERDALVLWAESDLELLVGPERRAVTAGPAGVTLARG